MALLNNGTQKGFSIIEIIIVIAIFASISIFATGMLISSTQKNTFSGEHLSASFLVREAVAAVFSIRNRDFSALTNGNHGLDTGSGYYQFSGTADSGLLSLFYRTITVEDVERDGTGAIVDSGGTVDDQTKKITITVAWDSLIGSGKLVDFQFYISSHIVSTAYQWIQDTTADFVDGFYHGTIMTTVADGEIALGVYDASWSNMSAFQTVDISGSTEVNAMAFDQDQDNLYLGLSNNTGNEFIQVQLDDVTQTALSEGTGLDIGANVYDVEIYGQYAFLATGDVELIVIDLYTMTQVNSEDLPGSEDALSLALSGTTLAIGRASGTGAEVYFYDITDPVSALTALGSTEIGDDILSLEMNSLYAFLGTDNNTDELSIVRLSDYTEVNTVNLAGNGDVNAMMLADDTLFLGRDNAGSTEDFFALDISTPETVITTTLSVDTDSDILGLDVQTDLGYAFLATGTDGSEVRIVDLSTFSVVQDIALDSATAANAVLQIGGYIHVGTNDASGELTVLQTGSGGWGSLTRVGNANLPGNDDTRAVVIDGDYAYIGRVAGGAIDEFAIYDISDPTTPTLVGSVDIGADINGIIIDGNYAYLATSDNSRELDIFNISVKALPVRIASVDIDKNRDGLAIEKTGNTIFIGRDAGDSELISIDVSTPASPVILDEFDHGGDVNEIASYGNYLIGGTDSNTEEIAIWDVTLPVSIAGTAVIDLSGNTNVESIFVAGDVLYIGRDIDSAEELLLYDISTPASPVALSSFEVGDRIDTIFVDGDYAFLGTDTPGAELFIVDISNTSSPSFVTSFDAGDVIEGLDGNGTSVIAVSDADGMELQIFQAGDAASDIIPYGTFTSQIFDTTSAATVWSTINWSDNGEGAITFRLRTADSLANMETAIWVGSDGTADTQYTTTGDTITLDPAATGSRFMQWKAYIESSSESPHLDDVTLEYAY